MCWSLKGDVFWGVTFVKAMLAVHSKVACMTGVVLSYVSMIFELCNLIFVRIIHSASHTCHTYTLVYMSQPALLPQSFLLFTNID